MEKGIVITTGDEISVQEFSRDGNGVLNTALRKICGDSLEKVTPVHLPYPYCFICNEEGLILNLPVNIVGCGLYGTYQHGHPIVGNIVILKLGVYNGERDVIGIPDEEIADLLLWLVKRYPCLREVST